MKKKEPDNRMASELLASASILEVLPSIQQKGEFTERALQTVLGLQDSALCLKGYDAPSSAKSACAKCGIKNTIEPHEFFKCPLSQDKSHRVIQVSTVESFFGYFIIPEASVERSFLLDDLLINFLTILSISIENLQKSQRIQEFNQKLQSEISERSRVQQSLTESEERYHSLFTHMDEGLAYCQMLFDAQDRPVDFIYLGVNDAFERLTGLQDVAGKKVTEVIPGIKESSPELFEIYGRVALTGKPEIFETHFKPLDSWLSISVYSTELGNFVTVFANITERKRAEEMIRENEERLKIIFELAPDAYYMSDLKGNFVDGNKAAEELLGFSRNELIGKSFLKVKILSPKQIKKAALMLAKNILKKSTGPDEFVLNRKNGSQVTVEIRTQPVKIHNKTLVLGIVRDITERKRAEETLRVKEERYRELFDNISSGVAVYEVKDNGEDFVFVDFNKAGERLDGDRREDIIGKSVFQVRPGIKEFGLTDVFKRVWKTGTAEHVPVTLYQDGRLSKWYDNFVYRLPTGEIVALYNDITERKRLEDELIDSKALVDAVVENIPLMLFLKEAEDLRFILFNRAGEELLGYERKALLGKNNLDLFPPEQAAHFMAKDREVLDGETGILDIPEEPILTAKKDQRLLHTQKVRIRGKDGTTKYLLGISEDITVRKQAEEKLKSLLKEKEVLIKEVHHRVKNNFAIVSSLLNMQSREIQDKDVKEMFMQSRDRINSIALIHERLYQTQNLTHINFSEYISSLVADLFRTYGTDPARVSLVTEIDDIVLDVNKVIPCGLIVNELIINALKYGFPTSWSSKGQIKVSLKKINDNDVELTVMDNGVGLPEGFDIHNAKSLGLKLVTMLAEGQLGGEIKVVRNEGTGFFIRFKTVSKQ